MWIEFRILARRAPASASMPPSSLIDIRDRRTASGSRIAAAKALRAREVQRCLRQGLHGAHARNTGAFVDGSPDQVIVCSCESHDLIRVQAGQPGTDISREQPAQLPLLEMTHAIARPAPDDDGHPFAIARAVSCLPATPSACAPADRSTLA